MPVKDIATKKVLVVGANRGIGLNLVEAFKKRSWEVTGSIRPQTKDDESVNDLRATGANVIEMDFLHEATIEEAAKKWDGYKLDLLVNVGGLPPNPKSWQEQTPEMFVEKFQVMAVGPYLTCKHFHKFLRRSDNPRIVNITSAFGSVTDNTFGTCMAYRVAKAAANQVTVTFAREWEKEGTNVTIVCMEPGFVATRLTGYDAEDDMETCIAGMMNVIESLTPEDNGRFIKWDGSKLTF
ncbi:short chain dehydrogenase [Zopfia rhizophila CBS 207.26]|uniref:Short chain dehydrogenase n=1 Tax=Zopfia rhizophila CBS 207.26 TaxID=1314779 RepID=A0A6A6DRA3_9PEZI|nr:short chain dehydrogenase [Zopfia rhizophila CBS 207.26]